MADELVPQGDFFKIRTSKFSWRHPDPKLAFFVQNLAICGFSTTAIAKATGCDIRILKKHYESILDGARAEASGALMATAMDMAITDRNEKIMVSLMNRVIGPIEKKAPEPEEEEVAAHKSSLNYGNLDKEQMKKYHELVSLMQAPPKEPIKGEAREIVADG